jgi:hypothetical protein
MLSTSIGCPMIAGPVPAQDCRKNFAECTKELGLPAVLVTLRNYPMAICYADGICTAKLKRQHLPIVSPGKPVGDRRPPRGRVAPSPDREDGACPAGPIAYKVENSRTNSGAIEPASVQRISVTSALGLPSLVPGKPINLPNRRVRTRMHGGVGGAGP